MAYSTKLLSREVVSVAPSEPILNVVRLMRQKHIGCVVVAKDGQVVGIFTERDLVCRVVADAVDVRKSPVSQFMTPKPITVEHSEPMERVFQLLSQNRFRHVPITENGKPVGIVSLSDFAGVLSEVFSQDKYIQYFVNYFQQHV